MKAGDNWKREIENALDRARAAILMVTADFLASDFVVDNELPPLLSKAKLGGTRIIPVILKPCRFTRDKHLREFQAINDPQRSVIMLDEGEQVYDGVARLVEEMLARDV